MLGNLVELLLWNEGLIEGHLLDRGHFVSIHLSHGEEGRLAYHSHGLGRALDVLVIADVGLRARLHVSIGVGWALRRGMPRNIVRIWS